MFVFTQKQYPENFTFLILTFLELFAREVFLISFYLILLFLNVCKQTFLISHVRMSENAKDVLI